VSFTFAMAWIGVFLGLLVPPVEVAQRWASSSSSGLTFLSNAFVPTGSPPGFLQPVAEWRRSARRRCAATARSIAEKG
jgi:ABC-2 type transport system permease protein